MIVTISAFWAFWFTILPGKIVCPEKVAALTGNLDTQISTDVIFHSLADMGGLTALADSAKSVFSPHLRQQDKIEMLNGQGTITEIMPR